MIYCLMSVIILTLKLNNCICFTICRYVCITIVLMDLFCIKFLVHMMYMVYFMLIFLLQLKRKRDLIRLQRNMFVSRKVSIWLCKYMYECMYICNYLLFCLLITSVLLYDAVHIILHKALATQGLFMPCCLI